MLPQGVAYVILSLFFVFSLSPSEIAVLGLGFVYCINGTTAGVVTTQFDLPYPDGLQNGQWFWCGARIAPHFGHSQPCWINCFSLNSFALLIVIPPFRKVNLRHRQHTPYHRIYCQRILALLFVYKFCQPRFGLFSGLACMFLFRRHIQCPLCRFYCPLF